MRLAAIAILCAATSCDALFGGFSTDNPDNCVRNGQLCVAPDEACNPTTRLCEPAIQLDRITPSRAVNTGGDTIVLTGKRLTPDLTVLIGGMPASMVTSPAGSSGDTLTVVVPANPTLKGLVSVELVPPQGQRQHRDDLFAYYSPITFRDTTIPGYRTPRNLFASDVNGDGRIDIVVCDDNSRQLAVVPGNGDGTFGTAINVAVDIKIQTCALGDLNGDRKPDVVISDGLNQQLQVFLNGGSAGFQKQTQTAMPDRLGDILIADLNGDGKGDLLASAPPSVEVRLGDGLGAFGSPTDYPVMSNTVTPVTMTLADLNGDGRLDVLAANGMDSFIGILYADGQGGFRLPATALPVSLLPRRPIAVDINMDGKLDLLSLANSGNQLLVINGNGDGTYQTPQSVMMANTFSFLAAADLNGDGTTDLASLSIYSTKNFMTLINLGDGTLVNPQVLTLGLGPTNFAIQDVNGDGKPDAIANEQVGVQIHVLLNTSL